MLSFQEAASPCSVARVRVPKRVLLAAMLAWMAMPATAAPRAADPASQAARAVAPRDEAAPLPRYSLPQLLELARAGHPALAASRAQVQAAQAGMITAQAWPNPEVEAMTGRQRARMPGAAEGRTNSMSITQKLDLPWQRTARMQAADAAFEGSQAQARSSARDLEAQLKLRFYDVLRREAEQRSAREDVTLVEQIRRRVAVRVETGEAPRYELIRGDAELLNAQRTDQAAALRVQQALRGSVDRQPDLQDSRVGLVVSIPLFDRREGPVGEAVAALERARATLRDRELQMRQAVESAYRQYEIAQSQVGALESGVVKQAESTLRVAEAAYRHGERGILDYLDAQRVFRQARNDLIAARADLRAAAVELDRLRAEAP